MGGETHKKNERKKQTHKRGEKKKLKERKRRKKFITGNWGAKRGEVTLIKGSVASGTRRESKPGGVGWGWVGEGGGGDIFWIG